MTSSLYPQVAIYNDKSSGVPDAEAAEMVKALVVQAEQFEKLWHTHATLHFVPSTSKPPASYWTIALLNDSDQAGALGYHDLTPSGLPLGKVFAGTDRQYGQSVSVTLSHELLEMLGDPWINLSAQGPDGKFYAWEACDAVEDDGLAYEIVVGGVPIKVSNFCGPAWWGNGSGKLDWLGKAKKPLELLPGGYIGVFDPSSGQGWTQLTAQKRAVEELRDGRKIPLDVAGSRSEALALAHAVPRVGSRRERRFRKSAGGAWLVSTYEAE